MELYVLTIEDHNRWEGNDYNLIGVFDNLTDVITEAKKLNFNEYRRRDSGNIEGFYDSEKEKADYIEFLRLRRVVLNEPVDEDEA